MSYANKYYPDYKKLYPGVEITPEVLATLRASDRQMRRFEEELKAKGFEVDNEKQTAKFMYYDYDCTQPMDWIDVDQNKLTVYVSVEPAK